MTKHTKDKDTSFLPAFVDRIEDEVAVIILSDAPETRFNFPIQYLPPYIAEGDHLRLLFELDIDSTEATRNRVAALQSELATETETTIKL
jgi:hypothetical protein